MAGRSELASGDRTEPGLWKGILGILVLGTALGFAYNQMGRISKPGWGLDWIGKDPVETLPTLEATAAPPSDAASFVTRVSDPMAIGSGTPNAAAPVPEVQELDRPIQVELAATKQFFDAGAAIFIDAREPDEFAEGRIPGALSMPFDLAVSEPERLGAIEAAGRVFIVYCGGGACELSVSVAWELLYAGQTKVLVYMGGYPEWVEAGYPVDTGAGDAAGTP